jgi:ABC-2 type transport system permease protein
MFAIYKRLWLVNWAEQWQYRANLLMYLAFWLVSPIVYLAVWTTVANAQGSVNGFTAPDFVAYYMVLLIVDIATSDITIHILGYKIMDGSLSNQLMLPIHPILTQVLVNNLAFKALQLVALVPIWLLLYVLYQPVLSITITHVLLAVPAIALGFMLQFFAGATLTCIAFWTTRVWAISEFYGTIFRLLAGQFVPLALLPAFMQSASQVLPFRLALYFPIQLLLGKLSIEETLLDLGLQAVWCVILFVAFRRVWRAGLKKYSAVGA